MPAAGAEIGEPEIADLPQPLDLFPDPGHGAGVEHLQLEPAHILEHGPAAEHDSVDVHPGVASGDPGLISR